MISMLGIAAVIFYFTIYSFFGWLLENSYSFVTTRKFFKDGFLWGPVKPMYGFAPVMLVYLITPETNWLFILLLCLLIPTIVEYVSGFLLQTFFHRQWWDYSKLPLQFHGHICVSFSICWIFLAVICLKWIHPVIASMYGQIASYWIWLSPFVVLYFIVDLFFAIRKHLPQRASLAKQSNTID